MQFTTPTNIDEMYQTLTDIFYYYRIKRESYEVLDLQPLNVTRLTFTPFSDEQLTEKAKELLSGTQQREVLKLKKEISEKISVLEVKISSTNENYLIEVENVNSRFNESEEKIKLEATNKGLLNTNITLIKLAELETAKNNQLALLENQKNDKVSEYQSQIAALNTEMSLADSYYSEVFQGELLAKVEELKLEQDKKIMEIQKYNNSLDAEEIKYENNIIKANADLKLKYAQLKGQFMSKEELVEMGYYADVLDCVCGYYNTLSALDAYNSIKNEEKLAIYLDDYYSNILYLYKTKANI